MEIDLYTRFSVSTSVRALLTLSGGIDGDAVMPDPPGRPHRVDGYLWHVLINSDVNVARTLTITATSLSNPNLVYGTTTVEIIPHVNEIQVNPTRNWRAEYSVRIFDQNGDIVTGNALNDIQIIAIDVDDDDTWDLQADYINGFNSFIFTAGFREWRTVTFTIAWRHLPPIDVVIYIGGVTSPYPPLPQAHPFTDVWGHWAYEAIEYVYNSGIMNGTTPTTFSPNTSLNRAMLITTLWRMMGEPAAAFQPVFSDVQSTAPAWYRDAVMWAYENGIVRGIDGRFDPYGEITREQFAAMLYRYAQLVGVCTNVPEFFNLDSFQDRDKISSWAEPYMYWAVLHELIQGVDAQTLAPGGTATRAQTAAILMRFLERLADEGFFL